MGQVSHMELRITLVEKLEGKADHLKRPRRRWQDNVNMDFKEIRV
jgi:hypothetical protein